MKLEMNQEFAMKNFHVFSAIDKEFDERAEKVHMENCYIVEQKCCFGDKNCPAKPISY